MLSAVLPHNAAASHLEITILADEALMKPLIPLARMYARENGVSVSVISSRLQSHSERIRGGLPVDVVVTSDNALKTSLNLAGQVDQNASGVVALDPLVVAMHTKTLRLNQAVSLEAMLQASQAPTLILPPMEASENEAVQEYIDADSSLADVPIQREDSDEAVVSALQSSATFSILPRLHAQAMQGIRIVSTLPGVHKNSGISYTALVVASNHMKRARLLAGFLKSPRAQKIFVENGFVAYVP